MNPQALGWPQTDGVTVARVLGDCPHCGQSYTGVYNGQPVCLRCSPQHMCYTPAPKDHLA